VNKSLEILKNIVAHTQPSDLKTAIRVVFPSLVRHLGNQKGMVRRSTMQCLRKYQDEMFDPKEIIRTIIEFGFDSPDVYISLLCC